MYFISIPEALMISSATFVAVTALMYGTVVWGVQPRIAELHLGLRLMMQLIAGVAVFVGAAALFRLEALRETLAIVRKIVGKG